MDPTGLPEASSSLLMNMPHDKITAHLTDLPRDDMIPILYTFVIEVQDMKAKLAKLEMSLNSANSQMSVLTEDNNRLKTEIVSLKNTTSPYRTRKKGRISVNPVHHQSYLTDSDVSDPDPVMETQPSTSMFESINRFGELASMPAEDDFPSLTPSVRPSITPVKAPAQDKPKIIKTPITGPPINNSNSDYAYKQNNNAVNKPAGYLSPITILGTDNWITLKNNLAKIVHHKFLAKPFNSEIKLLFSDTDDYRRVAHYLEDNSIRHILFNIEKEPLIRVILKRIPADIPLDTIKSDIEEGLHVSIFKISRLKQSAVTNFSSPLILIQLVSNEQNKVIYQLQEVFGLRIQIEDFKRKPFVLQCYNCQKFHHGASSCHNDTRCVKCAGAHKSSECQKSKDQRPRCFNCKGDHVASFRGCPAFPSKPFGNIQGNTFNTAPTNRNSNSTNLTGSPSYASVTKSTVKSASITTVLQQMMSMLNILVVVKSQ